MRPFFVLACLALVFGLAGCLSAPADVQAEFERGAPNHYRPAGVIDNDDEKGAAR